MHSKFLHVISISLFALIISSYIVIEICIRADILPFNRLPYPKLYENVAGRLKPNVRAIAWWNPDLPYKYSTNSNGFRNNEGGGENVILCIGDSYTFGLGVNDNETYPSILEQQLNRKTKTFSIINAGSMDTGIDDHIKYYQTKGKLLKPELVIVQFNIYDIEIIDAHREEHGEIKSIYTPIKDDTLEDDITINIIRTLTKNNLCNALYGFLTKNPPFSPPKKHPPPNETTNTELQQALSSRDTLLDERRLDAIEKLWTKYRSKLKQLHDVVVADGSDFLLLIVPDPYQIHEYANAPSAALSEFCQKNGIKFEDMTSPFRTLLSDLGTNPFLEPLDIHCNAVGNTLISQHIIQRIRQIATDEHFELSFSDNKKSILYSHPVTFELTFTDDGNIIAPKNDLIGSFSFSKENTTIKREAGGGVKYLTTAPTGEVFAHATLDFHLTKDIDRAALVFFPHANPDSAKNNRIDLALRLGDEVASTSTTLTQSLNGWSGFDTIAFLENQSSSPTRSVRLDLSLLRDAGLASEDVHGSRPHRRLELYLYPATRQAGPLAPPIGLGLKTVLAGAAEPPRSSSPRQKRPLSPGSGVNLYPHLPPQALTSSMSFSSMGKARHALGRKVP